MELYHSANELLRIPVLKDGVPESLPGTVVESVRLFEEVTQRSPQFVKGWTGLAEAAEWEYELRGNRPPERLAKAKAAGLRAVELAPDSEEAWTRLSSILFFRVWDFPGAEAALRRAIELNPRNTLARQRYVNLLNIMGRAEEARLEIERAIQMQPAAASLRVEKAKMLYQAGRSDEAIREAEAAEGLTNQMPVYPIALAIHGLALEQKRQFTAAEKILRASLAIQPHDPWNEPALGHLLARTGRTAEAEVILAELRRQGERGRKSHVAVALVSTALGRYADALTALERGFVERDDAMPSVGLDPRFQPLHGEARFQALTLRFRQP
jgi:tetratricopeptide (TPR) repeat protein